MKQETLEAAAAVHLLLASKKLTAAVAESCTGGLVSHLLTLLPGSSAFFAAGFVTYSEEAKKRILCIDPGVLSSRGAVSGAVAGAMAEAALRLAGADIGVATTGNLGPDVLEGKERGLVYIAISRAGRTETRELHLTGDRDGNKEEAAVQALRFLEETIGQP